MLDGEEYEFEDGVRCKDCTELKKKEIKKRYLTVFRYFLDTSNLYTQVYLKYIQIYRVFEALSSVIDEVEIYVVISSLFSSNT